MGVKPIDIICMQAPLGEIEGVLRVADQHVARIRCEPG
jgi:hypothetical protein